MQIVQEKNCDLKNQSADFKCKKLFQVVLWWFSGLDFLIIICFVAYTKNKNREIHMPPRYDVSVKLAHPITIAALCIAAMSSEMLIYLGMFT